MGQAKNRGTRDDRIADALEEQNLKIEEVRKNLNLPEDSKFCGFLVHLVERDEFLSEITTSPVKTTRKFIGTPEAAYRFANFADAHKWIRQSKSEIVVGLFDIGDKLLVAQLKDYPANVSKTFH